VSLNPALEDVRYCPRCAHEATVKFPRSITCPNCGYGAFYNPKPVACAITANPQDEIILARRGFEPNRGRWSMPGGFVDLGESVEQAAMRETKEEICVDVELTRLVGVYSRETDRVMLVVYEGLITDTPQTTDEAPTIEAFAETELPWDRMAFWSTTQALEDLLNHRA
jgi:ADP-ribose pyrophosphatase YjhB (NUDIX family)